jgi:hypothetical protein
MMPANFTALEQRDRPVFGQGQTRGEWSQLNSRLM